MKLVEILDYNPKIIWQQNDYQFRGKFRLDNKDCEIQIDEYEVLDKTLIDFGFVVNGSIQAVNGNKPETKLLGAVFNGAKLKIKELGADLILISVMKNSGMVESRKSIYSKLARLLQRSLNLIFDTDWVENSNGFYRIWSNTNLTEEQISVFINYVKQKD